MNPIPKFTHEDIEKRYLQFVKEEFLSDEEGVKRTELLPQFWVVTVPTKDFKVAITCECNNHFHGIEKWCAVVEEPNGEKSNFMLFEEEIEAWAQRERELRGIE
ncbi:hypothetical protein [Evansella cellulosilytica]|uniref:Uncharacterized protein n=1 Tax=Evansella cellulosilytica (strain ATCC 21833 / DSM 2522 / FERM P-1141 / JCM 9156 / N-4) TaxID=649639 RepID=E6TVI7_EVAC2|nr:hypothetical protein [Evansella cellulosilytica]ADU31004.1 hypothetical protein Bcell_2749 [Evansella cellulosilytica DSM 2522]